MFDSSKWVGDIVWYASWHAAVLAGVLLVFMPALRRVVPPGPRSLLWLVIFARLVMPAAPAFPFSFEAAFSGWNSADVFKADTAGLIDRRASETAARNPALHASARPDRLQVEAAGSISDTRRSLDVTLWLSRLCLVGWLAGVGVLSVRYAGASIRLKRLIGSCPLVDEPRLRQLAEECGRQCGLTLTPTIRRAPDGLGASIVGLLRPVLLVSDRTLCRPPAEVRLIFLHEMRHARVGDCWFGLGIRLLSTIHWFNPFVWLSARAWQAERELACDAWVLRQAGASERGRYGRTLLGVLEETSGTAPTLLSIAMASPGSLIERRLRQVNRPPADSNWRRALAVALAAVLAATGLTDAVRSQGVANQDAAKTHKEEPQLFNVIVAANAYLVQGKIAQNMVLTDWKLVTWDELRSLLLEAEKGRPTTVEAYLTNSVQFPDPRFNDLSKRFLEFYKKKSDRVILCNMGPNASKRYDAIRNVDDLKTDRLVRRAGTLVMPDGRPAVGAAVVLCEQSQFAHAILLDKGNLSNPGEEFWAKTDEQGRFTLYSKAEHFAVVALHPSGVVIAAGQQLESGRPLKLEPWARIKLKGYADVSVIASRTVEGKDAVQLDFYGGRGGGIQIPPGRVSLERLLENRLFDTRELKVAPGETIDVDVQPPAKNTHPDK